MSDLLPVRGVFIPGAPDGSVSESDLAIINATTARPFDASDIYAFACVMAGSGLTDYGTRLGVSSLNNFAADAAGGIPYLLDHNPDGGIYGYTYSASFNPSTAEALSAVFIPTGRKPGGYGKKTSDQEIADIAAGMRREVSVGFGGPLMEWRCDLCGNDVFSVECMHLPGMRFDGRLATATIENARLVELSGVYRGACPGAVIGKSQELYARSQFSAKEFRGWLDKNGVPDPTKFLSTQGGDSVPSSRQPDMGTAESREFREKENKPMSTVKERLQCALDALKGGDGGAGDIVELSAEVTALRQFKDGAESEINTLRQFKAGAEPELSDLRKFKADTDPELTRLRDFYATELSAAKHGAKALALAAYGQEDTRYKAAEQSIEGKYDVSEVRAFSGDLELILPDHLKQENRTGGRQSLSAEHAPVTTVALTDEEKAAMKERGKQLQSRRGAVPFAGGRK